ncbi:MAG TPA: pyridoxal-dependent decarboxylase [Longimicrobiales bacterium]|nr:pyridoxal-dependent decarboxylase [Longimicrobiales bacterium]
MSGAGRSEPGDLPPEEFRRLAHQVADWMADYLEGVGSLPVFPDVRPGFLREALPETAPDGPEDMDRVLEDFRTLVLPGMTHWNHPSFHAWFSISGSGPGILGEMLTAALNVNAMVWRSSPAATELEEHTLSWLRGLLGLPEAFMGTINDTASHSTLYALAAAREQALAEQGGEDGLAGGPRLRCYGSAEAHFSVDKAVLTLGLGRAGLRRVATNPALEMDPGALSEAIRADRSAGDRPMAVVATLGTTSTTAVDPLRDVARICAEEGLWLHVDAAYGGPLALLPELHDLFDGWEAADSIVVNPHKWLFTPVDCSVLYCRRPEFLRRAFSLTPEYLRTDEGAEVTNLMDYGVALGRRFRALKLWFVLRAFGAEGLRERLRHHLELAAEWVGRIQDGPGWELAAACPMATPVFRFAPPGLGREEVDALNQAILDRVNASGVAFLSHTRVDGRLALRLSIGNIRTTRAHLARTWAELNRAAAELTAG